jgi:hypothetical protein
MILAAGADILYDVGYCTVVLEAQSCGKVKVALKKMSMGGGLEGGGVFEDEVALFI